MSFGPINNFHDYLGVVLAILAGGLALAKPAHALTWQADFRRKAEWFTIYLGLLFVPLELLFSRPRWVLPVFGLVALALYSRFDTWRTARSV